jgi:hypothetical protein
LVLFWFLREEGKSNKATLVVRLLMVDRRGLGGGNILHRVIARIKVCADEFQKKKKGEDFLWRGQFKVAGLR